MDFKFSNRSKINYENTDSGHRCPKCKKLAELAEKTLLENGFKFELEKVTDVFQIIKFKVMSTPALAIDGKVYSARLKIQLIDE